MKGRLPGSVKATMVLWATAVVAAALVAAGIAVLMSLRVNLTEQAQSEANDTARRIALGVATWRGGDTRLELPKGARDGIPVQVTDENGRLLAVGDGLESISGTGVGAVHVPRAPASPAPSPSATPAPVPAPATQLVTGTADDHGRGRDRNRGGDDDASDDSTSGSRGSDDHGTDDHGTDDHGTAGSPTPRANDPAIGTIGDTVQEGSGHAVVDGHSAPYRFATIKATDLGGRTVLVHAGASLAARESAVRSAAVAMLAGLPLVLLVVGGVTWLVTQRALAPVEGIRREMAAITASEDLSRRVPEPASRDEVARLARIPPMRRSPRWRPPSTGSAASSPTPPTNCAAPSPRCALSWRSARPTRSCWTCPGRSRTPSGCSTSRPICCCSPGWTPGNGRVRGCSTSASWSARRRSAVRPTVHRCPSTSPDPSE